MKIEGKDMDIELTTTTTAIPSDSLINATSPESFKPSPLSSPTLSPTPLSTTLPTHQMHSTCRIYQPKMTIRRRCRSECLQMAPTTNPSLDAYLEHLNELRQKLNFENSENETIDSNPKAVIESHLNAVNGSNLKYGRAMFSIIDSFRASDRHNENIKENISTDSIINDLKKKIIDDSDGLDNFKINGDYASFCCDELDDFCTDQVLVHNQKLLLKINEEIDRKYFDILNSARNKLDRAELKDCQVSTNPTKDGITDYDDKHTTENRRRARARSESQPHDISRLEISPSLAAYKCAGDDLSLKRAREDKTTESIKFQRGKSCSPTKLNGYHIKLTTNHLGNIIRNRSSIPRHFIKSLATLKRQKVALLRARTIKRATTAPPSIPFVSSSSAASMVVSVPLECTTIASSTVPITSDSTAHAEKCIEKKKDEDSDTEYSSLEDDDDYVGVADDDGEDSITESEDNFPLNEHSKNSITNLIDSSVDISMLPAVTMLADCVKGQPCGKGPITPSLFSNVPPYITFATHEEQGPEMPAAVTRILKWKLTTITPIVLRKILINSGFRLLKNTNDYMGVWGKHMKSPCFKTIRSYQKINHIPGSFQIGRKDRIWRNLQTQMSRYGRKEFNFMPHTYILPQDLKQLRRVWPKYNQKNTKWIIKPPASARGTGIKVVNKWTQIPKRKPLIVQKYVDRPLLINGSKFDLRLYVLLTSVNPLRAYMHTDGLARFASVKYSDKSDTLSDRYMHLTNYSINKLSANYTKNEDAAACQGHKWTVKTLLSYLGEQGVDTGRLWAALRNLVIRTIFSGEHAIHQMTKVNVGSKYNCFELYGIDVILDSELKPWLLEVNISPSLHSSSPLDLYVKSPLVTALLNTALFQIPPRLNQNQQQEILSQQGLNCSSLCLDKRLYVTNLTKAERIKHNQFAQKAMVNREEYLDAILENLTPDDVRCLVTTEDELVRCAPLERVFPTQTTHRYLQFTENPRYYNRLLDAWETRYGHKRQEGIELLQKYCSNKFHLIVPPQPVKKVYEISNECENTEDEHHTDDDDEDEEAIITETNKKMSSFVKNETVNETVQQNKDESNPESMEQTNSTTAREIDNSSSTKTIMNGHVNSNNSSSNDHGSLNNHVGNQLVQSSHRVENCKHDTPLPLTVHSGNTPIQSDSDSELLKSPSSKLFLLNSNDIENAF